MGGRCIGRVVIAAFATLAISGARSGGALAQPAQPQNAGDSKGAPEPAGSDPQTAAPPPASSAKDPKDPKDPKLARKWLLAGQQLMQKGSFFAANNRPDEAKAQFENA